MVHDGEMWTAFQGKLANIRNEGHVSPKTPKTGKPVQHIDGSRAHKDRAPRMPPILSRSDSEESRENDEPSGRVARRSELLDMHLSVRRERKEIQLEHIKQIELERYKYRVFLTMKHDILKKIKDEKLDELIAVLRERKFARLHIIQSTLNKILAITWNGLRVGRIKLLQRNTVMLSVLRVYMAFKRFQKQKYGRAYGGPESAGERARQGFLKPSLNATAMTMNSLAHARAEQMIYHFLRDRSRLYWGFAVRQRKVMEKFDVIRAVMKKKVSIFRHGMVLIIQEIEESYQQIR